MSEEEEPGVDAAACWELDLDLEMLLPLDEKPGGSGIPDCFCGRGGPVERARAQEGGGGGGGIVAVGREVRMLMRCGLGDVLSDLQLRSRCYGGRETRPAQPCVGDKI